MSAPRPLDQILADITKVTAEEANLAQRKSRYLQELRDLSKAVQTAIGEQHG